MMTGFRWKIDWAAYWDPNSMTAVFQWMTRMMIDWASDSDPIYSGLRRGPLAQV